jgi:hypothetical protein
MPPYASEPPPVPRRVPAEPPPPVMTPPDNPAPIEPVVATESTGMLRGEIQREPAPIRNQRQDRPPRQERQPRPQRPPREPKPPREPRPPGSDHFAGALPVIVALLMITVVGFGLAYVGLTRDDNSTSAASGPVHEFNVFYTLADRTGIDSPGAGQPCKGKDAYADMTSGAAITLKDNTGKVRATGKLSDGSGTADVCQWHFVIHNLPEWPSYNISVSNRAGTTLQLKDLQDKNWVMQIPVPAKS